MRVVEIITDLQVADLAAARAFWTDHLGLSVEESDLGWVARCTSPEIGVNLQLVTHDAVAAAHPVVTVKVDDVDVAAPPARLIWV